MTRTTSYNTMHEKNMLGVYISFEPDAPTVPQHDEWADELFATIHFEGLPVPPTGFTFVSGNEIESREAP